ncbi:MAG: hypothetical protein ACT4OL_11530 [Nitrospiraceae bacterium]
MADVIRAAQYFKVQIADTSGTLAHLLAPLHEAAVNLLAVHAFPRKRRTQVDLVPEDLTAFKNTVKPLKWKMKGPQTCFLVDGDDRPGAMANLASQLSSAKINITAVTGKSAGQGRFGAILWVKQRDVKKAAKVFGIA